MKPKEWPLLDNFATNVTLQSLWTAMCIHNPECYKDHDDGHFIHNYKYFNRHNINKP